MIQMKQKNKTILALCSILTFGLLSSACSNVESSDLETNEMRAEYTLRSESSGLRFSASFYKSSAFATYVKLDDGDTIVATQGDKKLDLKESEVLGAISYSATSSDFDPNSEVTFEFIRTDKKSALASSITMASPIEFNAPRVDYIFDSREDDLYISWPQDKNSEVELKIDGSCIDEKKVTQNPDEGEVTIYRKELKFSDESDRVGCDITLDLSRTIEGTVDSEFSGGSIKSYRSDTRKVEIDND